MQRLHTYEVQTVYPRLCKRRTSAPHPSGLKNTAPSGGTVMLIDCLRPFHAIGAVVTRPRFPFPPPPKSVASLFSASRQAPLRGTPTR